MSSTALGIDGERISGQEVRDQNVLACQSVANILKTSLGPVGLDKMLVDSIGDVTITNDGATILKLLEVEHPAARVLVELAQQQDAEVGDGTTSVVILAGELLKRANELVKSKIHPTTVISGFRMACREAINFINDHLKLSIEAVGKECLEKCARTCISSKVIGVCDDFWASLLVEALLAVRTTSAKGQARFPVAAVNILKAHGQSQTASQFVRGYALNCTVAAQSMRQRVTAARIACLDMSFTRTRLHMGINVVVDGADSTALEAIRAHESDITMRRVSKIIASGANVVLCSKGIDDVFCKMFQEANVMAVRRVRKEDLRRIAKASGATLVSSLANLDAEESFEAGLLGHAEEVAQEAVSDDHLIVIRGTKAAGSASLILRGANDLMLEEMERAVHDALCVIKRTLESNAVVAGGGAVECALSIFLENYAGTVSSREQLAIGEFAQALLVIPRTLTTNAAKDSIELVSLLRAYHNAAQNILATCDTSASSATASRLASSASGATAASSGSLASASVTGSGFVGAGVSAAKANSATLKYYGLDLVNGEIRDNLAAGVIEPALIKIKSIKAATEAAISILRIDDFMRLTPESKQESGRPQH